MSAKSAILVLNGPNINLLGRREPEQYGDDSWEQIAQQLQRQAEEAGCSLECFQSNSEGQLIDRVHAAIDDGTDGLLCNPAALTHCSIALRDALLAARLPFIEVHISNIYARESFRQRSLFSDIAVGVVSGLGGDSYRFALAALLRKIGPEYGHSKTEKTG